MLQRLKTSIVSILNEARNRNSSDIVFVFAGPETDGKEVLAPSRALLTRSRTLLATPTQAPQDPQNRQSTSETLMARIFGKIRMIQTKNS